MNYEPSQEGGTDSTEVKELPEYIELMEKQGFHRKTHQQPMMENANNGTWCIIL